MSTPIPVTLKRPNAPIKAGSFFEINEPMTSNEPVAPVNLTTEFNFMMVKPDVSCPHCGKEVEHPDWCPCIVDQDQDERLKVLLGPAFVPYQPKLSLEDRLATLKMEPLPRAVEAVPLCNLCLNSHIACICYLCQRCGVLVKYKTGELPLCVLCMLVCHVNGCCKQCFADKCDGSCSKVKRHKH